MCGVYPLLLVLKGLFPSVYKTINGVYFVVAVYSVTVATVLLDGVVAFGVGEMGGLTTGGGHGLSAMPICYS